MDIKNLVNDLVKKFEIRDPFEITLAKGIKLLEEDLGNVYGYSLTYKRKQVISVNSKCNFKIRKLICAHELGYLLIHKSENIHKLTDKNLKSKNDFEKSAKIFVAYLLISDETLEKYKEASPEFIAEKEKLPLELVSLRLSL